MKHRIVIQEIRIRWTKLDRGAEQGALRHAIPRDAPFLAPRPSEKGWYHTITHDSAQDYRAEQHWHDLATVRSACLPVDTRLDGEYLWIGLNIFPLRRRWLQRKRWIVRLPFGQRCAIRLNNGWDGDHQRLYREHNVAVGFAAEATLDLPLFRDVDQRTLLY